MGHLTFDIYTSSIPKPRRLRLNASPLVATENVTPVLEIGRSVSKKAGKRLQDRALAFGSWGATGRLFRETEDV